MTSELFRGEEDIDRSKVIITDHAVKRFHNRSIENQLKTPEDPEQIKLEIHKLLKGADYKNAVSPVDRVKSLIDHGETQYFRYQRWQFVIRKDKLNPNRFLMITAIYLNLRSYERCFGK